MRNNLRTFKSLSFGVLIALLLLVAVIATSTYVYRDVSVSNAIIHYTVQYRIAIMVILVIISVAFGFMWATFSSKAIEEKTQQSQSLLDLVLLFLGPEEKAIVSHLVNKGAETTQSELSKLEGMNRVKAHRSIQKLHEKNIIHVSSHGKVRKVQLKESIYDILKEHS